MSPNLSQMFCLHPSPERNGISTEPPKTASRTPPDDAAWDFSPIDEGASPDHYREFGPLYY